MTTFLTLVDFLALNLHILTESRAKGQNIEEARTYDQKMQKIKQKKDKLKKIKVQKKKQIQKSLYIAQNSTASMGKFDQRAHDKEVHRKIKKRSQRVNLQGAKAEINRSKDILKMITKR